MHPKCEEENAGSESQLKRTPTCLFCLNFLLDTWHCTHDSLSYLVLYNWFLFLTSFLFSFSFEFYLSLLGFPSSVFTYKHKHTYIYISIHINLYMSTQRKQDIGTQNEIATNTIIFQSFLLLDTLPLCLKK